MNFSNLNLDSLNLSDHSQDLLEWVLDSHEEGHNDDRGWYCEFESYDCKPWKPQDVAELVDRKLVTLHAESDLVPTLDECDSDENFGGVAFLNVNVPQFVALNVQEF